MAFNINEFKSKVFSDKYGGLSKPNLFMMEIFRKDNSEEVGKDLSFFCTSINMPGINFNTYEYRPDPNGLPQSIPVGINYAPINAIIMLDDNHKILSFFHEWMQMVYNYNSAGGKLNPRAGDPTHFPHELGYKSDYSCNMNIRYFSSNNPSNQYVVSLEGVYPYEITALDLSWDSNDQISKVAVQFSYSKFKMQGARSGPQADFGYVYGSNIAIKNYEVDNNLSDKINRVARTIESFNGIKNILKGI